MGVVLVGGVSIHFKSEPSMERVFLRLHYSVVGEERSADYAVVDKL
jgi:hypothetical protein